MSSHPRLQTQLSAAFLSCLLIATATAQTVTLATPDRVGIGAPVEIGWQGGTDARDFITIVPTGETEGRYAAYEYAQQTPVELTAPTSPGEFEIRYLGAASPYPTLARAPLIVEAVEATLAPPAEVTAGAPFSFEWAGPDNPRDFITIVATGTVNGPVLTVDVGTYSVVVQGTRPRRIDGVVVAMEADTTVVVPAD